MSIFPLHKPRFDALAGYTRAPHASLYGKEVAWFSDTNEHVIGVVIKDVQDEDFMFIILGRDSNRRFRCIEFAKSPLPTMDTAINALQNALAKLEKSGDSEFPQGDENKKQNDLFIPISPKEKLHDGFKQLIYLEGYTPALEILKEMSFHFDDPDGNFIQQFQTTGFDQRIFELYLYGVLNEAGFAIDRNHKAPDFTCAFFGYPICIEATTVNKSDVGNEPPVKTKSEEDFVVLLNEYYPIKYGSSLFSKIIKRHKGMLYWELSHVKNKPFILAIHDFQNPMSMTYTRSALQTYLYGTRATWKYDDSGTLIINPEKITHHKYGDKVIPSGFFYQDDSEHISAVLFSNCGTISKFNRMGYVAGFGSRNVKMFRKGFCYDHDPNASHPKEFMHEIHDLSYREVWAQGIDIFHNPNALIPLNPTIFPVEVAHHHYDGTHIRSEIPDFHPLASITEICHPH